jgi:hypothetical protein
VNNGYDVCADDFGDHTEELVHPQCAIQGRHLPTGRRRADPLTPHQEPV